MLKIRKRFLSLYARNVPKNIRHNFNMDVIAGSFAGLHSGFFAPFFALISRQFFDASPFLIGLIVSAPYVGSLFAMFYSGVVSVNKEMKYYTCLSYFARLLLVASLFVDNALSYCLLIFFFYLFSSIGAPQYGIIIQRIYPISYRAALMGYVRFFVSGLSLVATFVAGSYMKDSFFGVEAWRIFFAISGLCAATSTFYFSRVNVPNVEVIKEKKDSMFKFIGSSFSILKENKNNTTIIISAFFFTFGMMMLGTLIPIYQNDVLKITTKDVSILALVQNIFWIIGFPIWGKYIDKHNPVKAWNITCFLACVLPLNYFLVHDWHFLLVGQAVNGIFAAGTELAWFNMILYMFEIGKEQKYQALHAFFSGIRGCVGAYCGATFIVIAQLANINIKYIFLISIFLMAFSVIFLIKLSKGKLTGRK